MVDLLRKVSLLNILATISYFVGGYLKLYKKMTELLGGIWELIFNK